MDRTYGQAAPHRLPRLIYCLDENILLVSRVYKCCNEHISFGHHPKILEQLYLFGIGSNIPFVLWHQCGYSLRLMEHIQQLISSGMSLQECELSLTEYRLTNLQLQKKKKKEIALYLGTEVYNVDSATNILTQSPSRNGIKGCFIYHFGQWKMRKTTMPHDSLWLSCDHTFHTVANIQ